MTDKELINGILDNNQKYFKILVDEYQFVLNICNSFLHNKKIIEVMNIFVYRIELIHRVKYNIQKKY